jgi:hypothetical protein
MTLFSTRGARKTHLHYMLAAGLLLLARGAHAQTQVSEAPAEVTPLRLSLVVEWRCACHGRG